MPGLSSAACAVMAINLIKRRAEGFVVFLTLTDPANLLYGDNQTVCALIPAQKGSPKEAPMPTTTVTLEELESERADLLPSRETLHCCHPCGCGGGGVFIA